MPAQPTPTFVAGYPLRKSARAKRLQIRIRPWTGVEIVAPKRCSLRRIQRFVQDNKSWIDYHAARTPTLTARNALPNTLALAAVGQTLDVYYGRSQARHAVEEGTRLQVPADKNHPVQARAFLHRWLAQKTRDALLPRLHELAQQYGFAYNRVSVRGQRTRWGSCSAKHNLNINYKLLFVAPELVDYLFIHELAHTRELNHSARFWAVVEQCLPDYKQRDRQLSGEFKRLPAWLAADARMPHTKPSHH